MRKVNFRSFIFFLFLLFALFFLNNPSVSRAQTVCTSSDVSISLPLTDLGTGEYYRLTDTNPLTYIPTGIIGGLYPGGSNIRPPAHEASGVGIAQSIQPLGSSGLPDPNGKIGMISAGMSNTQMDFQEFMGTVSADPNINPKLVVTNGAIGGGIIEAWVDPNYTDTNPVYQTIWQNFDDHIASAGLTRAQVQVVWAKVTQLQYKTQFPQDMQALTDMYVTLAQELKSRLPNLKIIYFSSRTRSYNYMTGLAPEPTAFENGFAVRWLVERQINGDPALNYNPDNGSVISAYISWGPYLWINGNTPRSDTRVWLASNLVGDCTHPSTAGLDYVSGTAGPQGVSMMMEFFKTDTTSAPWFLYSGVPTPTPTPILSETLTPTPTASLTPTPTPTPTSTPPFGGLVSSWGFANDIVTDDISGCTGCVNNGAVWFTQSIFSGAYEFDGMNAYMNLGTFPFINNQSSFTVSALVRPDFDQNATVWRYVFNHGSEVALFFLAQNRDWRFMIRTTSAQYFLDTQGLIWLPGTWHMLTATYDGMQMKIFWDGGLAGTKAASGSIASDTGATYMGANAIRKDKFDGAIDELKVFDTVLANSDVLDLYYSYFSPTPTPTPTPTESLIPTLTPTEIPSVTPTPTDIVIPSDTPTPTPTPTPPAGGLVSSWGFATDLVTDDINGCSGCVNNGADWFFFSIFSGGYDFNGTTSYLNLGTFPFLSGSSNFTVSTWIRPDFDQNHTNFRYVFTNGSRVTLTYVPSLHDWRFLIRNGSQKFVDTQATAWVSGTWHLLTATYDGAEMKIYWDGNLSGTKATTGSIVADSGATYLGASIIRSDKFDGAIDELNIYDHALSASEVSSLFLVH
ncbi:MAG: hypothetical protein US39_C0008G0025 [Microgenomates group bacterium GW2011_GWC1_37_12b]|nr:MAG: hypothetical protein US39_C0008G0025 [Microgenomates group bacterium GW2011_GWC1_37_12b]